MGEPRGMQGMGWKEREGPQRVEKRGTGAPWGMGWRGMGETPGDAGNGVEGTSGDGMGHGGPQGMEWWRTRGPQEVGGDRGIPGDGKEWRGTGDEVEKVEGS